MKQKRKLIKFQFRGLGLNNNDFINCMTSAVIRYRLNRQKYDRVFIMSFTNEFLSDTAISAKLLTQLIYSSFKESLNIKHT